MKLSVSKFFHLLFFYTCFPFFLFTQTGYGAKLIWDSNSEPDLKGYRVHYKMSQESYESVKETGNVTEHNINYMNKETTYYITLTAYNYSGNESGPSDEVTYTVADGISGGDNPCRGGNTDYCDDNCPGTPNGPDLGTCTYETNLVIFSSGNNCTGDDDCKAGETCQMGQEDFNENAIGDACECYADCDNNAQVGLSDLGILKIEFGRFDCDTTPCYADCNDDGNVALADQGIMISEFGRSGCPVAQ